MFFPLLLPGVFSSSFFLERRRVVSAGGWRVHFSLFLRSSLHTTLVVVHPWWHGFVLTLFFPKNLLLFFPVCMFRVLKKRERERKSKGKDSFFVELFPPFFSLSVSPLSFVSERTSFALNAPQQKTTRRDIMFAAQSTSFTGAKVVAAKSAKTTRRCVFFYQSGFRRANPVASFFPSFTFLRFTNW